MTAQQDTLFGSPPVHATDPVTSHIAAERTAPTAAAHRERILAYLLRVGDAGATAYEAWKATGGKYPHVAGTRLGELAKPKAGPPLVRQTDRTRPTDTGTPALVWVLTPAGAETAATKREAAA